MIGPPSMLALPSICRRYHSACVSVAASSRGFVHGPGNDGLIKLVVDTDRDLLVGATAVGPAGGEVLGLMALAVHARVPVAKLDSMILAYPTFTRGVRDALIDLRS